MSTGVTEENQLNDQYTAQQITVLEGLSAVRMRPSMYIGNVSTEGLHHLVYEVVDTVDDIGRGIPVDIHEKEGVPAVEVVMTKLHAGGKFDDATYKVSGGLHGVGVSVVNALSEYLDVEIRRDGKVYAQRYERGITAGPLRITGETQKRGTRINFKPDAEIFTDTELSFDILAQRMWELAFLNRGVRIELSDERIDQVVFSYSDVAHAHRQGARVPLRRRPGVFRRIPQQEQGAAASRGDLLFGRETGDRG